VKRLLLIGDTSLPEALGSKLLRGAEKLDLQQNWQISISYHSPAPSFSPSMKQRLGKIFYRLADKRSWEWWTFQRLLMNQIKEVRPDLVLVTGILPLNSEVFHAVKKQGGLVVNYLTDDPWNPIHRRQSFISNLRRYDNIFSTKSTLQKRLEQAGAPNTSWLPFAYDPDLHYPVPAKSGADVLFIGTGAQERIPWLKSVGDITGIERRIHGNSWDKINTPGWEQYPAVTGKDYCEAIKGAKVVLGLLRQANGDQSTDRSYEIGAIGGCGLYQDTEEHRELLHNYPNKGFFKNPVELADRVKEVLADTELQNQLRTLGEKAIRRHENTYAARLKSIIRWAEK
jgi:spore maturation protein CgeB